MKRRQHDRRQRSGPNEPRKPAKSAAAPAAAEPREAWRSRLAVGGAVVVFLAVLVVTAVAARRARNAAIAARAAASASPATAPSDAAACCSKFPTRFGATTQPTNGPAGMVWLPGGEFAMGGVGDDPRARPDEGP